MKPLVSFLFYGLMSMSAFAQLRANVGTLQFDSPTSGAYLELHLTIKGQSVNQVAVQNGAQALVMVQYLITKGSDTAFFDLFKLNGPLIAEGQTPQDFIDIQRIALKDGKYNLMLTLRDLNNDDAIPVSISKEIKMDHRGAKAYVSDIMLVERLSPAPATTMLTKAGYDLVPYSSDLLTAERTELIFYCEVYNTDKGVGKQEDFVVNAFVENADDGRVVNNLGKFFRMKPAAVSPVLHKFPIADLPSGNYNLVIEARSHKNEMIERRQLPFFRSNAIQRIEDPEQYVGGDEFDVERTFVGKYNRPDQLAEYIDYLYPISTEKEKAFEYQRINKRDAVMMKNFLYSFWKQRNPADPEAAWEEYLAQVKKVNEAYSTNLMKGYRTDRGRVYLQYGPPNTIAPYYFEPNTYPFEIWHYYQLSDKIRPPQSNKKFVFANMETAARDFRLIHSDALDEMSNVRWNYDLHKRNEAIPNLDEERGRNYTGNKTIDFFNTPH